MGPVEAGRTVRRLLQKSKLVMVVAWTKAVAVRKERSDQVLDVF